MVNWVNVILNCDIDEQFDLVEIKTNKDIFVDIAQEIALQYAIDNRLSIDKIDSIASYLVDYFDLSNPISVCPAIRWCNNKLQIVVDIDSDDQLQLIERAYYLLNIAIEQYGSIINNLQSDVDYYIDCSSVT